MRGNVNRRHLAQTLAIFGDGDIPYTAHMKIMRPGDVEFQIFSPRLHSRQIDRDCVMPPWLGN